MIIKLLETDSIMSVSDLANQLESSMMTIRRDLESLENAGTVRRIHGGVVLSRTEHEQPTYFERMDEYHDEKKAIGLMAARLIKPGQIAFFDAGTTALITARSIDDDLEFTAITTGLLTAAALCAKPKVNLINLGGYIHKSSLSAVNTLTIENINKLHANLAFITTKALHIPEGTYETYLPLIEIKLAMVQSSEKVVLLADHSKFNKKSLSPAVPLDKIDAIVTDDRTPDSAVNQLKELGVEIHLAPVLE